MTTFDIEIEVKFNYPKFDKDIEGLVEELDISSNPYPHGVKEIPLTASPEEFFKDSGWVSAWAKELDDVDETRQGGYALIGEKESWLWMKKSLTMTAPSRSDPRIPHLVEKFNFRTSLKSPFRPNSPIVVCVVINGRTLAFTLHKSTETITNLNKSPLRSQHQDTHTSFGVSGMKLPFPQLATWAEHTNFQKNRPVSFASYYLSSDVHIIVNINNTALRFGHCAVSDGLTTSKIFPMEVSSDMISLSQSIDFLKPRLESTYPVNAIASLLAWGKEDGYVNFDSPRTPKAPKSTMMKKSEKLIRHVPLSAENSTSTKAVEAFYAPESLDLPDIANYDAQWYSNMRGVVFLRRGDALLLPHEVFDLRKEQELLQRIIDIGESAWNRGVIHNVSEVGEELSKFLYEGYEVVVELQKEQVKRVQGILEYQEKIGNSIAMQARLFLENFDT